MAAYLFASNGGAAALESGNFAQAILDASHIWAAVPEGAGALNKSAAAQPFMDYNTFLSDYHANGGQ